MKHSIQNYVKINIVPELQRIPGVGQAFCIRSQRLLNAHLA